MRTRTVPSIVLDINSSASPATMTICVVDRPLGYVVMELENVGKTREQSFFLAIAQMDATAWEVLDLLAIPAPSES